MQFYDYLNRCVWFIPFENRNKRNFQINTHLNLVLVSSLSSSSLLYQHISGLGDASSWHSNTSLLPSSSCRSCGFCVKLGAKSSVTPIVLATGHYGHQTVCAAPYFNLLTIHEQLLISTYNKIKYPRFVYLSDAIN